MSGMVGTRGLELLTSTVSNQFISNTHDHILVYGKTRPLFTLAKLSRTEEQVAKFKNPDADYRRYGKQRISPQESSIPQAISNHRS